MYLTVENVGYWQKIKGSFCAEGKTVAKLFPQHVFYQASAAITLDVMGASCSIST